jgi:hypothetical protein
MGSPHITSNDLLTINFTGDEEFPVHINKIKNAIIKLNYKSYPVSHHAYIQNIFYLDSNINTSPLLALRILRLLNDRGKQGGKEETYLTVNEVLSYLNNMGFENLVTMSILDVMLKKGLIYSYDPTIVDISQSKKIEITPSGRQHYFWGHYEESYIYAMIQVTPIPDKNFQDFLKDKYGNKFTRLEIMKSFLDMISKEDEKYCHIPDHQSYKGQSEILNIFSRKIKMLERVISNIKAQNRDDLNKRSKNWKFAKINK